jgi:hypothetical protein
VKKNGAAMKECIRRNENGPTFKPATGLNGQVSGRAVAFVKALLVREPEQRPRVDAVMELDYLKHASEFAAEAQRSELPSPCLFPMLYGAVGAGAYSKKPKPNPNADEALELQKKSRALSTVYPVHHKRGLFENSETSTNCDSLSTGVNSNALSTWSKSGSTGVNSDPLAKWSKNGNQFAL